MKADDPAAFLLDDSCPKVYVDSDTQSLLRPQN
jgi:hypothetical protein